MIFRKELKDNKYLGISFNTVLIWVFWLLIFQILPIKNRQSKKTFYKVRINDSNQIKLIYKFSIFDVV